MLPLDFSVAIPSTSSLRKVVRHAQLAKRANKINLQKERKTLTDTDPYRGVPKEIRAVLQRQYQEALETLCETMKDPDRERKVIWEQLIDLQTSGIPDPSHIPTLIELERITRETGGDAYMKVDRTVFNELERIGRPEEIPVGFLLDAFQYRRRYDNFARRRRAWAVKLTATIAAQTGSAEALDALIEMMSDPRADVREKAIITMYSTYEWQGCEMPKILIDQLSDAAQNDARQVCQTALGVLQRAGAVSYDEAVAYLEEAD